MGPGFYDNICASIGKRRIGFGAGLMMTNPSKKKILVVDDEVAVCKSVRQALLCEAYDIDMALSGREALEKEKSHTYDLFLVDMVMPDVSGRDLIRELRRMGRGAQIIMMSGYPKMMSGDQALELGAFDFLAKPFLPSDLRSVVARALATATPAKEAV